MVDVSHKQASFREARALGIVRMSPAAFGALQRGELPKGEALGTCRLAGIMAAKRTWELIPLCHPLLLSAIEVDCIMCAPDTVEIRSRVACQQTTGVEMEALTAVSVAALTLYDMVKAVDKSVVIGPLMLTEKIGGKSGHWKRPE